MVYVSPVAPANSPEKFILYPTCGTSLLRSILMLDDPNLLSDGTSLTHTALTNAFTMANSKTTGPRSLNPSNISILNV